LVLVIDSERFSSRLLWRLRRGARIAAPNRRAASGDRGLACPRI